MKERGLDRGLALRGGSYGLDLGDILAVAEQRRPGSAAALAVIEPIWAIEFAEAVGQAGGKLAAQGFLTQQAVMKVGEELEAIAEADKAIELSEMIRMEAAYEAAEAIALSEAIEAEAAWQVAEALLAAEFIEGAALEEAARVVATTLAPEAEVAEE